VFYCCQNAGRIEYLKLLLDNKADPNLRSSDGEHSPVIFCCQKTRRVEYLALLLENGADPDLTVGDGLAPAHLAANCGDLKSLELLICYGANFDSKDGGNHTPLDHARQSGNADCIALLLTAPNKYDLCFDELYDLDAADQVRTVSSYISCYVMSCHIISSCG
jgi:ankyrin repeat protein